MVGTQAALCACLCWLTLGANQETASRKPATLILDSKQPAPESGGTSPLEGAHYKTREAAKQAVFEYLEIFYNRV